MAAEITKRVTRRIRFAKVSIYSEYERVSAKFAVEKPVKITI